MKMKKFGTVKAVEKVRTFCPFAFLTVFILIKINIS